MNMKQFNVKQAERWLEKLKNQNLQSYKDITKFLRKYERTDDQHDCYVKISYTLLSHTELTKELNLFLEDGNKFVVTKPEDEKLRDFMGYVKKNRPEIFNKIISMIQELSKSKGEGNTEVSKMIMPKLKEITSGDSQLERLTDEALGMTDDQLIRKKNLEHLKVNRGFVPLPEDGKDAPPSESVVIKQKRSNPIEPKIFISLAEQRKEKPLKIAPLPGGFTNINEERFAIKQLEKSVDPKAYKYIIKLVKLYYLNLITKWETFELLAEVGLEANHLQNLKEILDTREMDRRKKSSFKPLADLNFSAADRASPSYVTVPFFYPVTCSGKTPQIRALTNDKWVSVPFGSQENQNFSVRNKNTNEINLLKAEDERYEFDLYLTRLIKAKQLLDRYISKYDQLSEVEENVLVKKIVDLGVIQMLYRMGKEDQKQELQNFINDHPFETCKRFRERLLIQIEDLNGIRSIHAMKSWNETAVKNFHKALDLKGFEFKKNEKDKMKNTFFMTQINDRNKILNNGGEMKPTSLNFEEKREFFNILNSFESSSRTEKCSSRTLPSFETFDLKDQRKRHFYPIFIIAFEDQPLCQHIYSLMIFYIENAQLTESEKTKCKLFLEHFLIGYMGWKSPLRQTLTQFFNQQLLYQKIANNAVEFDCAKCFSTDTEVPLIRRSVDFDSKRVEDKKSMRISAQAQSNYEFLPKKTEEKKVLYCSEHVYCFTRYLYAIYERFIRMREVAESPQKLLMFELLFYTSIKAKQSIKFQQNLNLIFGDHAYIFGTIYKLFDSAVKSAVNASCCALTNDSFSFAEHQPCEDLYLIHVNRFCLYHGLINNKIIRLTYNKSTRVIYINSLDCYYKTDDQIKDMIKKTGMMSRLLQMVTIDPKDLPKTSRKQNDFFHQNGLEHIFQNTPKMLNHSRNQDLLLSKKTNQNPLKGYDRQLRRVHKLHSITH